jgi:hypothetical protein
MCLGDDERHSDFRKYRQKYFLWIESLAEAGVSFFVLNFRCD